MLEIVPCEVVKATVKLPGSKYIANRLIPMCALASTPSSLTNIVDNDDIRTAIKGLNQLGYQLSFDDGCLTITPRETELSQPVTINTAHSGTFSRFVAAIAALQSVSVTIECSEKMASRPMQEIFSALTELGARIETDNQRLPAKITGPVVSQKCRLELGQSSQYLSALMIIAPTLKNGLEIELDGKLVSSSYIEMTRFWMSQLNVSVVENEQSFKIEPATYQGINVSVPGDAVSASYFMGLVAIAGGEICIESFDHDSLQGEAKFYQVLEKMGMNFRRDGNKLIVTSDKPLQGLEIDMGEMPDVVQTLAVIACFAKGKTLIKNIAHLAFKESNRISDTATELLKTGINVEYGDDYLLIEGGIPQAATIETYDDHRMAMSMALLGAKTKGIKIKDPAVVNKSFPSYWAMMAKAGLNSNSSF